MEQEGDAFSGVREHAGGHDDDQQEDEERRHEQLGRFLYAASDTVDNHEMRHGHDDNGPEDGLHGVGGELFEVVGHEVSVAVQLAHDGSIDILQAPAGDHRVIAGDKETGDNAEQSHVLPRRAVGQLAIGASRVRRPMAPDDKLADHAGDAQQQDTADIDKDESGTAVLPRHVGETPYITQADSRTCRG
jgi:hypothetical protein